MTETIVPTYLDNQFMNLENIKSRCDEGYGIRYVIKLGATKEDAIKSTIALYNELEKNHLIEPLIKLLFKYDNKEY